MKRICVFCGSSSGAKPEYAQAAKRLGSVLVQRHLGLVYGGGNVGLMGQIANAVIDLGGEVIGVIPRGLLERRVALTGLSDLRVVGSMHERKAVMAELADGFIALPGGLGTLEELFEVWTWAQLGLHQKPCGLLNICDYYSPLIALLERLVAEGFLADAHRSMVIVQDEPEALLDKLDHYRPPVVDKAAWALQLGQT
jgi:uncharacterized protein (TIGR00730 family)